ncbi:MAG TPA: sulfatase-like hydrolase/transferase [Pseudomonadales bacterium]
MVTRTRDLVLYPFVVLVAYAPFLLYMHHTKIGPRGLAIGSWLERLGYYHADLILYVLVALLFWLVKPARKWTLVAFSALYYLAAFDWLSWHTQNKSFSFADIDRGIQLIVYYPEFVSELALGIKIRALVLFALPIAVAAVLRSRTAGAAVDRLRVPLRRVAGFAMAAALLPAPLTISDGFVHRSSVAQMVSAQLHDWRLASVDVDRESMKIPFGQKNPPKAAERGPTGDNVIIFILETAPFSRYPDLGELAAGLDHPWLERNGIVFSRHYATYPASDRASYSILSGWYPPIAHHNNWKDRVEFGGSLPRTLALHGYTSYLFSTAPLAFYQDDVMYRRLGFTHLSEVEATKALRVMTAEGYRWDRERLYEMDLRLINMTIESLRAHGSAEQPGPFFAAIAPQSSHAPLNCPPEYCDPLDPPSEEVKFQLNAKWQFRLIERLIEELEASGLLDSTVLVITGDHGIRSRHETVSPFDANVLQEVTFHVPLMIASSRLGGLERRVDHPTSHVDIAPTVLDLLGLPRDDAYFHGRSLFDDSPRTIYFVGTGYLPVSGFLKNGRYYMENRSNDLILSAPTMSFDDAERTASDAETRQMVQDELLRLEAFLRREYRPAVGSFVSS